MCTGELVDLYLTLDLLKPALWTQQRLPAAKANLIRHGTCMTLAVHGKGKILECTSVCTSYVHMLFEHYRNCWLAILSQMRNASGNWIEGVSCTQWQICHSEHAPPGWQKNPISGLKVGTAQDMWCHSFCRSPTIKVDPFLPAPISHWCH